MRLMNSNELTLLKIWLAMKFTCYDRIWNPCSSSRDKLLIQLIPANFSFSIQYLDDV